MANPLDDIVKTGKDAQESKPIFGSHDNNLPLESRINSIGRVIKSVGRTLMTAGIVAGTYGIVGRSSLLTAGGNAVGYLIEKARGKEKIKEKELHKETRTGGILGTLGYALYSMIDFIPNYNLPLKIIKTLAFNPIMLAPYVAFYQTFTYLRDKVGAGKTALGLINLKIFKYLKEAYYNEIKPNFKKSMKKIMYLMPIHFASINYVTEIWKRVGIGVFNDIAFRLFQSKKKESPSYSGIQDSYRKPSYNLKPAYRWLG